MDGGRFTFYRPPELPLYVPGRQRDVTQLEAELARRRPLDREIVTTQRDPVEIDKSLEAIDRKAKAEFEDRGTHVLYLVWNLLKWADPKTGDQFLSPLVLVPLQLSRTSMTESYQLQAADDSDPFINPALRVKLELDFNLLLPDVDLDDTTPDQIVATLAGALPTGWSIERHAAIGIFGFAKEAMYRDLVNHAEVVAQHPVIRSMARGELAADLKKALAIPVPSEAELDMQIDTGYCVIDADSSQRRAIEAANKGLSFVLIGPPGTGKSQTITNIIAEFIGRGKSVLFVSQKMAALEVVANRLEAAELRDLVLELHSAKASRGEVANALVKALDSHPKPNTSAMASTTAAVQDEPDDPERIRGGAPPPEGAARPHRV